MFCENCGAQNADGSRFCGCCGAALPMSGANAPYPSNGAGAFQQKQPEGNFETEVIAEQAQPYENYQAQYQNERAMKQPYGQMQQAQYAQPGYQQQAYQQQAYQQQAYQQQGYAGAQTEFNYGSPEGYNGANPVIAALKKAGSSPLFLISAILFTAAIIFQIIYGFVGYASVLGELDEMLAEYGLSVSLASSAGGFSTILGQIPSMVMALGIWLIFAAAKKNSFEFKTAGLTITEVMTIIKLVIFCFLILILEIVLAIAMVASNSFGQIYLIAIAVVMAIMALLAVVYIIYYVKLIKAISGAKNAARYATWFKIPVYPAVICFITGIGTLVMYIFSFESGIVYVLAGLCSAACEILFGIIMITCRNNLR